MKNWQIRVSVVCVILLVVLGLLVDAGLNDHQYLRHVMSDASSSAVPSSRHMLKCYSRIIKSVKPDLVVDVGCGTGEVLKFLCSAPELSEIKTQYTGIEIELKSVMKARIAGKCASVLHANMIDYEIPSHVNHCCFILYEPLFDQDYAKELYQQFLTRITKVPGHRIDIIYTAGGGFILKHAPIISQSDFDSFSFALNMKTPTGPLLTRRFIRHYQNY